MSAGNEIHLGDIGTVFRLLVTDCGTPVDISSANTLTVCFLKPDQSVITRSGTFTNAGTDGLFQYTAITGDLDQDGDWQWQGVINFPTGNHFHTSVRDFTVYCNICSIV